MFLKKTIASLVLLNLGVLIYHQEWAQQLIDNNISKHEPERLSQQIRPGAITVKPTQTSLAEKSTVPKANITPEVQPPAPTPAPIAPSAEAKVAAPACTATQKSWLVYMGPYANEALLNKKIAELKRLQLKGKPVSQPSRKLGLSLGEYETESSAQAALAQFNKQGVKTAYVVVWSKRDCGKD